MNERIIVALDYENLEAALRTASELKGLISTVKAGWQLYINYGYEAVRELRKLGFEVFLDLKLHDIPFQVAVAAKRMVHEEVRMLTCHILGGAEMMQKLADSVREEAQKEGLRVPEIFGVTILTSLDDKDLADLGISGNAEEACVRLAALAHRCGLAGVVASPQELAALRAAVKPGFKLMTPGIRLPGGEAGDQKRFLSPGEAFRLGADYLVIGRPVTGAPDPGRALEEIILACSPEAGV